jgi:hypothetical protein
MTVKTKRNLKALRRLRAVFRKVPADRVHMRTIEENTSCGTACCLLGWGMRDAKLRRMGLERDMWITSDSAAKFFGIGERTAAHLFAFFNGWFSPEVTRLTLDPHAITKAAVLRQLDRVIAGKPIKPYKV